jgi:integrase
MSLHSTPCITPPVTIKHLVDLFMGLHVPLLKDPRPLKCRMLKYFPPLYDRPIDQLTVIEITRWRNSIKATSAVQAMASLKDLRHLYNKAIEWDLYAGANLAARIKNERPPMRKTYIREHEMPQAVRTIFAQPLQTRLHFYGSLILACRPIELQNQHKADVRVWREGTAWQGLWTKPKGTTKTSREHTIPLPPLLAEMYALYIPTLAPDELWMFPGRNGRPLSKEFWFAKWDKIRTEANLPHVWCYDLRRTGSTWANDTSGNLSAVSKGMLDHTTYQATDHYVQVMDGTTRAMLGKHEQRIINCSTH